MTLGKYCISIEAEAFMCVCVCEREREREREGNGTPLQYSCLENPMDGGAW